MGLNQGTLAPVGLPIGLYDWPVPLGRVPVIALRTHIDPLKLNLLSQDKFFGFNLAILASSRFKKSPSGLLRQPASSLSEN